LSDISHVYDDVADSAPLQAVARPLDHGLEDIVHGSNKLPGAGYLEYVRESLTRSLASTEIDDG
jgi:hypothetical protein